MEIILILGLLFIFGLALIMHLICTCDLPIFRQITGFPADPAFHPWFLIIEAILLLTMIYIGRQMI